MTTPNRTTVVTLDAPGYYAARSAFWLDWYEDKIAAAGSELVDGVHLIPGIGWRVNERTYARHAAHELADADAYVYRPGNGNATGGTLMEVPQQRWMSEFTDVPQGDQRATGDFYLRKKVSGNLADVRGAAMAADQTAFPGPDAANDLVPMDRLLVSTSVHRPDEGINFLLQGAPTSGNKPVHRLATVYFSGVAGCDARDVRDGTNGLGQYALTIEGDGRARLWEKRADATWRERWTFRHLPSAITSGGSPVFDIKSDAKQGDGGKWEGTYISFACDAGPGPGLADTVAWTAKRLIPGGGPHYQTYKIPQVQKNNATLAPVRADVRRDMRVDFAVARHAYQESGVLRTKTFHLPWNPSTADEVYLEWFGSTPAGTSVECRLYRDDDGTEFASSGGMDFETGGWRLYTGFGHDCQDFYAEFTFTATATATPTIRHMVVYSPPLVLARSSTPVVLNPMKHKLAAYSATGPGADPSTETASLLIHDLGGDLAILRTRSEIPVRIEVAYNPAVPAGTSVLFSGYAIGAKKRRRGNGQRIGRTAAYPAFPAADWATYEVTCVGEWMRLHAAQMPKTRYFNVQEQATGESGPWKVTDMIRVLLQDAGYPDAMIDVPDLPTRLMATAGVQYAIEQFSAIGEFVVEHVRDYLGGYLVFDPNAQNGGDPALKLGCWRLRIPPRPPYTALCAFHTATPAGVGPWTSPARYPDVAGVKQTWVRAGSLVSWVVPPEFNVLYVAGAGGVFGAGASMAWRTTLVNWKSARFYTGQEADGHPAPDPNDPDFLGYVKPMYLGDPGLNTAAAVALKARRTFDMGAHAQKRLMFEAPLVLVTDPGDALQVRPRPLRFGDIVTFDAETFVVASVDFDVHALKGGSRMQHAVYELFNAPALSDYSGIVVGRVA